MQVFSPSINGSRFPVSADVFHTEDEAVAAAKKYLQRLIEQEERLLSLEASGIASGISKSIETLKAAQATAMKVDVLEFGAPELGISYEKRE